MFKAAQQIVQLEPELAAKIEIISSTKTMVARPNGSIYRAISAEAGTKHGYSPSVADSIILLEAVRYATRPCTREFDRVGLSFKDGEKGGVGLRVIAWGQGYRDMAGAIDALEVAIMERKLVHANIPIMNFCIGNAVATTDPAGNRKMDKEKARFRIDAAVALAMAMGLRARDRGSAHAIDIRALIG